MRCRNILVILQSNPLSLSGLALNRGDLLVFLAAAFFAAYSVAMRYRPAVHSLSLMSITFSVGALCLLPVWVWEVAAGHTMTISLPTILTIGYLMLFPSVIAYFCFNRCIELIGSVRAGFSIQLVPVFSSLLGVLLLGEPFARYHAWGTVLIAAGILLTMPLASVWQEIAGYGLIMEKNLIRAVTERLLYRSSSCSRPRLHLHLLGHVVERPLHQLAQRVYPISIRRAGKLAELGDEAPHANAGDVQEREVAARHGEGIVRAANASAAATL